jgi:hypothetical protein
MAKHKKNNKKDKKAATGSGVVGKASKKLRALSQNPLMADVVAAALVATAAALKDSKKAQRLAADAGDELETLAKKGAQRGNAMWQLALDIGRKALEEIGGEVKASKRSRTTPPAKAKKSASTPRKKVKTPAAGPKR